MNAIEINKLIIDRCGINIENVFVKYEERVGILGSNYKTRRMVLKCLLGVNSCRVRDIKILGMDINKERLDILERLGIAFSNSLDKSMKIKDLFKLHGSYFRDLNTPRIEDVMKRFYLYDLKGKRYKRLNSFMKSKLDIAISVINSPEILIYDGILDNLKSKEKDEIKRILLSESIDRTLIIGSDSLESLLDVCDIIYEIKGGRLNVIYGDKE